MLQAMRKSQGTKKFILGIVVISVAGSLALAMYGLWGGGLSAKEQQGAPDWIATVDGESIPTRAFQKERTTIENDLRQRFAGQLNDDSLGAFVDQQALGALLGQHLLEREAGRAGLRVTPAEISDDIVNSPAWQREGRFVGVEAYRRILESNRINVEEFEAERQRELAAEKLKSAVASLAYVDDAELDRRFRDQEERVDLDYVVLSDSKFGDAKTPSDADLQSYFRAHASEYMTPETRRASYVLFDREAKAASMQIGDADIKDYYEKNKATLYSHPEQRRASHILFKLEPNADSQKEAAVRDKATAVLARVRSGEDFATLARQNSEDEGSAPSGGDLGYFGRGRMVREFEDAVFSLKVGSISDVVKSGFGYHIIKVTDSRPAGVQPLDEVKEEIRRSLSVSRAQEEIRKAAADFTQKLGTQEASFDKTAAALGEAVLDTGFFGKGQPAGPLGRLPQVDDAVFGLKRGVASAPVTIPQGIAVFSLTDVKEPQPAPFDAVKTKIEADLRKSRARDKARSVAADLMKASGDLKSRALKAKLEVKTFDKVNRIQPLPPLTDAVKQAAFAATTGAVIGPFDSDDGLVIVEVKGKSPSTPEEASSQRAALKQRMLDEERNTLFQALLDRLQKSSAITINDGLLRQTRNRG